MHGMEHLSREYFLSQCLQMRQFFGSRDFWDKSDDQQNAAINGLMHVYLHSDITEDDISTFQAIIEEFFQRRHWIWRQEKTQNND